MTTREDELVELRTGKRKCPSLEPTLSERPLTLEEWRELGKRAASALAALSSERDLLVEALRELSEAAAGAMRPFNGKIEDGNPAITAFFRLNEAQKQARAALTGVTKK